MVNATFGVDAFGERAVAVVASRASSAVVIDGQLDETAWSAAVLAGAFRQVEPDQGALASATTEARVLVDDEHLYVGAYCRDSDGREGVRAPDLSRDFDYHTHDVFAVTLDTLNDGRSAVSFQVNPYGAQRDLQALDDQLIATQWDGVWRAATQRHRDGWSVEIAIPWKTLRYRSGTRSMGLQLHRVLRRTNEVTAISPWPRAYTPYRVTHFARLEGIAPPQPSSNVLLRPFVKASLGGDGAFHADAGGDVRWSPRTDTTIDLSANTDFAEADVDRQIINLTRSDVFLPERRPFFLESASLFSVGLDSSESGKLVDPFVSRRIGITDEGRRVPLDGGARLVMRRAHDAVGALVVRQRGSGALPASTFAVGRYVRNLGERSRIGWFGAARLDETSPAKLNVVPAIDALARVDTFTFRSMLSSSYTNGAGKPAGFVAVESRGKAGALSLQGVLVSERYDPRSGFVFRRDVIYVEPHGYLDWRPSFLPPALRALRADATGRVFHRASDGRFQEATVYAEPIWAWFHSTDEVWLRVERSWQSLTAPFEPVRGLRFGPGDYQFGYLGFSVQTDPSRKVTVLFEGSTGEYYDARVQTTQTRLGVSPIPHLSFVGTHTFNRFSRIPGGARDHLDTHLAIGEARLAVSPRLQLIGLGQYNSDRETFATNVRLAWELAPLSFAYLIYSDTHTNVEGAPTPLRERQLFLKLTYTWQI